MGDLFLYFIKMDAKRKWKISDPLILTGLVLMVSRRYVEAESWVKLWPRPGSDRAHQ